MAIIIESKKGLRRPRITCDGCEQPMDLSNGLTVFDRTAVGKKSGIGHTRFCHTHPGCRARARKMLGYKSSTGPCENLDLFLVLLCVETGLDPDQFRELWDDLVRNGEIQLVSAEDD